MPYRFKVKSQKSADYYVDVTSKNGTKRFYFHSANAAQRFTTAVRKKNSYRSHSSGGTSSGFGRYMEEVRKRKFNY